VAKQRMRNQKLFRHVHKINISTIELASTLKYSRSAK
jgi:hypothetical protein